MLSIENDPDRRGGYVLNAECILPATLDEVFAFYSDALNLAKLTPPHMNFRVVTQPPIEMKVGTLLDYELKVLGIPLKWQSEITEWEPKVRFADEQRKGPYKYWEHEHTFTEVDGGVRVCDRVHYGVPGGALVHRLKVKPDIQKIFAYREEQQAKIFGAA